MKLAIMQPYLFPYIGYFQLVKAVDKFVFYDDVNFMKGGWINRNNVLINQKKYLFTVPLDKPSPYLLINETVINLQFYNKWKIKFLRSLEQSYKKTPFFHIVYPLVVNILELQNNNLISKLGVKSIKMVSEYLQLQTEFIETSSIYNNQNLSGQERVLDICRIEQASQYINLIGGIELYSKDTFNQNEVLLSFIKSKPVKYNQFENEFIPWLSIIDVMMFNSPKKINVMLDQYALKS